MLNTRRRTPPTSGSALQRPHHEGVKCPEAKDRRRKAIDSQRCPNATRCASTTPPFMAVPSGAARSHQEKVCRREVRGGRSMGNVPMPGMRCDEVGRPVITILIGRSVSNRPATPGFGPRRRQRRRRSWRAPLFGRAKWACARSICAEDFRKPRRPVCAWKGLSNSRPESDSSVRSAQD